MMRQREEIIKTWFDMWLGNDPMPMEAIFTEDVVYCECQGREYIGLAEVNRWFVDWHKSNQAVRWIADCFLHENDKTLAGWHFEGEDESGNTRVFDGVYLVEWDGGTRISSLREYGAKLPLERPYQ